jgi:hypothetical protein
MSAFGVIGIASGSGFLRSSAWWFTLCLLLSAMAWHIVFSRTTPASSEARGSALGQFLVPSRRSRGPVSWRLVGWIFLLVGWISSIAIVGGPAIAVAELGSKPGRTVALNASSWSPCLRCSQRANAVIQLGDQPLQVALRGVDQNPGYYRAGILVVFRLENPTVAMAAADYADGTARASGVVATVATILFVLGTWALARIPSRARA